MDYKSITKELNTKEYKYDDRTLAHIYFELKEIFGDKIQKEYSTIVLKRVNNIIYEYWKNNLSNVCYSELNYMLNTQYYIADVECCKSLLELNRVSYRKVAFKWELLSEMIDKVIKSNL